MWLLFEFYLSTDIDNINGYYGKERTLEEVGKQFGVTRERIRQIETKAIRKLRHPSRAKHLRDFL